MPTDHNGKPTSVITGASSGIGRWIALGLAQAGHHVLMVCRDSALGTAAQQWIAHRAPQASTELHLADLSSLEATRRLGRTIAAAQPRLALLLNNAGAFTARRHPTPEGHDTVLTVNHLSPYLLTELLEPSLRTGAPSRIVNTGSSTSDRVQIDPDDLALRHRWSMVRAYGGSKLAMMATTFARAHRLRGTGVVANVVHPGTVATTLVREPGPIGLAWQLMAPFLRTEQEGAETSLQVALRPEWRTISAAYIKPDGPARPNPQALDPEQTARIDAATRVLIGLPP